MKPLHGMLAGIAISVLFGLVGGMDFEDAQLDAQIYCANVYSGIWPDYENNYEKECKDGNYIRKD